MASIKTPWSGATSTTWKAATLKDERRLVRGRHGGQPSKWKSSQPRREQRFKSFTYEELTKRDKVNLDILIPRFQLVSLSPGLILRSQRIQVWFKKEALEECADRPGPDVVAADIVEGSKAPSSNFAEVTNDLKKRVSP